MNVLKLVRYIAWGVCGAVGIGIGVITFQTIEQRTEVGQKLSEGGRFGVPFQLVRHDGQPVDQSLFSGKPSLVYFGFTFCPDVCPTTMNDMTGWAEALGPEADKLNFVFVTVDPERDTPEAMENYITSFSDRIIGISGEPEDVRKMLKGYKVYFSRVPLDDGDYTMDHSAAVYILDSEGDFAGSIPYGATQEDALVKIRKALGKG